MQRLHRVVESAEQLAPFLRDPRGDDPPVGRLSRSPCQIASLEAIEEPGDVRVACRGAIRHRAERGSRRSCIAENPQDVVLLRRDAVWLEQGGELVNELAGGVLEQEVDLPLRRFDGFESPGPSRWILHGGFHDR